MGIYDRDYIRQHGPTRGAVVGRGVGAVRMWSVTTWLIVICIGVFVIDHFLPPRDVPTGIVSQSIVDVPRSMWDLGPRPNNLSPNERVYDRAVVEKSTGKRIGEAEVYQMRLLESWLHFSTRLGFFQIEYWRFIGFQFLHANLAHLLFNMIGLYFFGPLVERHLGSKRYLAFYLLCGIFGAVMYLILNLGGMGVAMFSQGPVHIPGLLFNNTSTPLVGASAGIFGVLMAGAFLAPNALVLLMFIPMRLQTMAYALVIIALISILFGGANAGGEAGHLGGALAGFYFIRHPHHLHGFFDILGRVDPTSHHYREKARKKGVPYAPDKDTVEVDRILDKIQAQGIHSLTESEKRTLRAASQQDS